MNDGSLHHEAVAACLGKWLTASPDYPPHDAATPADKQQISDISKQLGTPPQGAGGSTRPFPVGNEGKNLQRCNPRTFCTARQQEQTPLLHLTQCLVRMGRGDETHLEISCV